MMQNLAVSTVKLQNKTLFQFRIYEIDLEKTNDSNYEDLKQRMFEFLRSRFKEVLVSAYDKSDDKYIHAFVRTQSAMTELDLKDFIMSEFFCIDEEHMELNIKPPSFHFGSVKCDATTIREISKIEDNPLCYRIAPNYLSPYLQIRKAFKDAFENQQKELSLNSSIMYQTKMNPSFIQKAYLQYVEEMTPHVPLRAIRIKKRFNDWRQKVVDWAASWANTPKDKIQHKKKQMYLYGVPNSGKTTLVNSLFGYYDYNKEARYVPNITYGFGFEGLNIKKHNWMLFDECSKLDSEKPDNNKEEIQNFWKRLVAGEEVQLNRKCKIAVHYELAIPMAFLSNNSPPTFLGFRERVLIVHANKILTQHYDLNDYVEFVDLSELTEIELAIPLPTNEPVIEPERCSTPILDYYTPEGSNSSFATSFLNKTSSQPCLDSSNTTQTCRNSNQSKVSGKTSRSSQVLGTNSNQSQVLRTNPRSSLSITASLNATQTSRNLNQAQVSRKNPRSSQVLYSNSNSTQNSRVLNQAKTSHKALSNSQVYVSSSNASETTRNSNQSKVTGKVSRSTQALSTNFNATQTTRNLNQLKVSRTNPRSSQVLYSNSNSTYNSRNSDLSQVSSTVSRSSQTFENCTNLNEYEDSISQYDATNSNLNQTEQDLFDITFSSSLVRLSTSVENYLQECNSQSKLSQAATSQLQRKQNLSSPSQASLKTQCTPAGFRLSNKPEMQPSTSKSARVRSTYTAITTLNSPGIKPSSSAEPRTQQINTTIQELNRLKKNIKQTSNKENISQINKDELNNHQLRDSQSKKLLEYSVITEKFLNGTQLDNYFANLNEKE